MQRAWIKWVAAAAVLAAAGTPLKAADNGTVERIADDLGQRAVPAPAPGGQQAGGLSESAVRVLMTYAFSIIPEQQPGPEGKTVKVDKSDPNKFLIPDDDARRVIRAATRSAYAEVCQLEDLALANYQTLMKSEQAKKIWSYEQILMINALHMFATSYFGGNTKIVEVPDSPPADGAPAGAPPANANEGAGGNEIVARRRPDCPPEQKQKVVNAINAYVQAAQASPPPSPPSAPVAGAN